MGKSRGEAACLLERCFQVTQTKSAAIENTKAVSEFVSTLMYQAKRLVATLSKIKSFFSVRFNKDNQASKGTVDAVATEKAALEDSNSKSIKEDARERLAEFTRVVGGNLDCQQRIFQAMKLPPESSLSAIEESTELKHFDAC